MGKGDFLLGFCALMMVDNYFGNVDPDSAGFPTNQDGHHAIIADNDSNFYDYNSPAVKRCASILIEEGLAINYLPPPGVRRALSGDVGNAYRLTDAGLALVDALEVANG